jgi:hypothetical protein
VGRRRALAQGAEVVEIADEAAEVAEEVTTQAAGETGDEAEKATE